MVIFINFPKNKVHGSECSISYIAELGNTFFFKVVNFKYEYFSENPAAAIFLVLAKLTIKHFLILRAIPHCFGME